MFGFSKTLSGRAVLRECEEGSAAAPTKVIGKILTACGIVRIIRDSGVAFRGSVAECVCRGDVIETEADGAICILLKDGTVIRLGGGARVDLSEVDFGPDLKSNSAVINIARGTFAFITGKLAETGALAFNTPLARIRGTAQSGGIGALTATALIFSVLRDAQAAAPEIAILDDGILTYKDLQHGVFVLETVGPNPRIITVDDPGQTVELRLVEFAVSVNSVENNASQMASLNSAYHGAFQTFALGQVDADLQQQNIIPQAGHSASGSGGVVSPVGLDFSSITFPSAASFAPDFGGSNNSPPQTLSLLTFPTSSGPPTATFVTSENVATTLNNLSTLVPLSPAQTVSVTLQVNEGTLALAETSGLTITTNGSHGTLTFSGSSGDVSVALASVVYTPLHEYEGPDTLKVSVDGISSATASIFVTGVPETPTISTPTAFITNENAPHLVSGLSVASADPGSTDDQDTYTATLYVEHGTLSVGSGNFTVAVTGTGTSGNELIITGSRTEVNLALTDITYTPTTEYEGADTVHFTATTTEEAAVGGGTSAPAVQTTATIMVEGVPETPTISTPAAFITNENAPHLVSGLSVASADPGSTDDQDTYTATLYVEHGTLSVGSGNFTVAVTGTGTSGNELIITGSRTEVNLALTDITYTPTTEYEGADTVHFTATTTEEAAVGGGTSAPAVQTTATIMVEGVPETPTISTPAAFITNENAPHLVSGLSVASADPGSTDDQDTYTATLYVEHGTLSVGSGNFTVAVTGTGTSGNELIITGSRTEVNLALTDITYTPTTEYEGADTVHFTATTTEEAAVGGGTSAPAVQTTATIMVEGVPETPTISTPAAFITNENAPHLVSGLSVASADPGSTDDQDTYTATLYVEHGTLSVGSGNFTVAVTGTGTSGNELIITGSRTEVNLALTDITYTPTTEYEGADTVHFTATTTEEAAVGGGTSAPAVQTTATIMVEGVPETPTISTPAAFITNENAPHLVSGLSVASADPGSTDDQDTYTATLYVEHGTLSVGSGNFTVAVTGTGTSGNELIITGSRTEVNLALTDITYTPTTEYEGADTVHFTATTTEEAAVGGGTSAPAVQTTATIMVEGVPETPTISTPAAFITNENAPHLVSGLSVASADPGSTDDQDTYTATLYVEHGTLSVGSGNFTVAVTGTGTSGNELIITGSRTEVNLALTDITYTPTTEYEGADTVHFTATTTEEAAVGGGTSAPAVQTTATIMVEGVPETPTISTPAAFITNENAPHLVSGLSVASADPGSTDDQDTYTATLYVEHGTLSVGSGNFTVAVTGTGTSGNELIITGSRTEVNLALTDITYTPTTEYEGADTVHFTATTTEEAAVGGGTSAPAVQTTATIMVEGVPETPTISTPAAFITNENAPHLVSGLSVASADPGSTDDQDTYTATLYVEHGTLSVGSGNFTVAVTGTGTSGNELIITGSRTEVNLALTDITYTPTTEYEGADTVHFTATTTEEAAVGGGTSAPAVQTTATIMVEGVPETPTISTPAAFITNENAPHLVSGLSVASADPGSTDDQDTYTATLYVEHGTLSVGSGNFTVAVTGTGTSGNELIITGSRTEVNLALTDITYTPTTEYEGADTVHFTATTTEEAAVGGGTSAPAVQTTATIMVEGVPETPTISTPAAFITNENAPHLVSGLSVASADPGSTDDQDTYTATLYVEHGTLSVGSGNFTVAVTGTGTSGNELIITGSRTEVNLALTDITYTPTTEYEGADTVHFTATTTEEAAVGGGTSAPAVQTTATIMVEGVPETPTISTPAAFITNENAPHLVSGLSVASADPGSTDDQDTYTATLYVEHGTLSVGSGNFTVAVTGTGTSGNELIITGSRTEVNLALTDITYTPTTEYEGADTVHFTATTTEEAAVGGGTSAPAVQTTATIMVEGVPETPDEWLGGNSNWSSKSNWSEGVPTADSDVLVGTSGTYTLTVSKPALALSLTIDDSNATVRDDASLVLTDSLAVTAGIFELHNGSFQADSISIGVDGQFLVDHGNYIFSETVTNDGLFASADNTTVEFSGAVSGLGSITIGSGASIQLDGADTSNVIFTANAGEVILQDPHQFNGTISSSSGTLSTGDQIDLTNITYSSHDAYSTAYDGATNITTLTVTDGTTTDAINLVGNYTNSTFTFSPDSNGGTIVVDPPVTSTSSGVAGTDANSNTVLSQPNAIFDAAGHPLPANDGTHAATEAIDKNSNTDSFKFLQASHNGASNADPSTHVDNDLGHSSALFNSATTQQIGDVTFVQPEPATISELSHAADFGKMQHLLEATNGGHEVGVEFGQGGGTTPANAPVSSLQWSDFVIHHTHG